VRRTTATICLTVAVLLGSVCIDKTFASEKRVPSGSASYKIDKSKNCEWLHKMIEGHLDTSISLLKDTIKLRTEATSLMSARKPNFERSEKIKKFNDELTKKTKQFSETAKFKLKDYRDRIDAISKLSNIFLAYCK
jgi:hypothetical protein